MAYCPTCRREYDDDLTACPEDQSELVEELPYQTIESDDGTIWVEIASVGTEDEARLLQGFLEAEEIPEFRTLVGKSEKGGLSGLSEEERRSLLALSFNYIEARHRLGLIEGELDERIVAARKSFEEKLPEQERAGIAFYDPERYNPAATLQDNILFGRLAFGQARADETVQRMILSILEEAGLREAVMTLGMDYDIGFGGKRLSNAQQQKLAMARALVKEPDLLIASNVLLALDGTTQRRILKRILDARQGRGVIWSLQRPDLAREFDEVALLSDGRIQESGAFDELATEGSALQSLIQASGGE